MAKDYLIQAREVTAKALIEAIGTDQFYALNAKPVLVASPADEPAWEAYLLDPRELGAMQMLGLLKWMAGDGPLTAAMLHEVMTVGVPVLAEECELVRNRPENFFARDARR